MLLMLTTPEGAFKIATMMQLRVDDGKIDGPWSPATSTSFSEIG